MKPLLAHLLYFWPLCAIAAWVVGAYQAWMLLQQLHSEFRRKYGLSSRDAFFALFFLPRDLVDVSQRRKVNIAMLVFDTFLALQIITFTVLYSLTLTPSAKDLFLILAASLVLVALAYRTLRQL